MWRIVVLVLMSMLLTTTAAYAEDLSDLGDVESINFDMKPKGNMSIVQDIPLPAVFAVDTWVGILDTKFAKFENKQNALFDNDEKTGIELKNITPITINFDVPITVNSFRYAYEYIRDLSIGSMGNTGTFRLRFYNDKNVLLGTKEKQVSGSADYKFITEYIPVDFMDVKKVVVDISTKNAGYIRSKLNEIEIFSDDNVSYDSVSDIYVNTGIDNIDLTYKNPESKFIKGNIIKLDGKIVHDGPKVSNYKFKDLKEDTLYKIEVAAVYQDGTEIWASIDAKTKLKKPDKPDDVLNLKANFLNGEIVLEYEKPGNADYVMIYKDSKLVAEQHKSNSFIDKDVAEGKTYSYKVIAVNSGGQSIGKQVSIKIPTKEVTNLRSDAKDNEVNLYWELPVYENFDMVMIYRLKKEEKGFLARLFSSSVYEPLFQTNGTYFKDMTVKPDTEYEYKLSTIDNKGNETPGVTIKVQTPKVTVGGSDIKEDENGDYVITWKTPTTGKIKVLVGGVEYKVVAASDKKIVIPKEKMKFDLFGKPDVKLVPIDEDGNEGEMTKPGTGGSGGSGGDGGLGEIVGGGGVADALNPENVLDGGVKLLGVVGLFVLLGLAFRVVPKLVKTIRNAFSKSDDVNGSVNGRRRIQE